MIIILSTQQQKHNTNDITLIKKIGGTKKTQNFFALTGKMTNEVSNQYQDMP